MGFSSAQINFLDSNVSERLCGKHGAEPTTTLQSLNDNAPHVPGRATGYVELYAAL